MADHRLSVFICTILNLPMVSFKHYGAAIRSRFLYFISLTQNEANWKIFVVSSIPYLCLFLDWPCPLLEMLYNRYLLWFWFLADPALYMKCCIFVIGLFFGWPCPLLEMLLNHNWFCFLAKRALYLNIEYFIIVIVCLFCCCCCFFFFFFCFCFFNRPSLKRLYIIYEEIISKRA